MMQGQGQDQRLEVAHSVSDYHLQNNPEEQLPQLSVEAAPQYAIANNLPYQPHNNLESEGFNDMTEKRLKDGSSGVGQSVLFRAYDDRMQQVPVLCLQPANEDKTDIEDI